MNTAIPVTNSDTLEAIRGFLKSLLTQGIVDSILVPMRTPNGAITPALVTNPELLNHADPLAPVLPVNSADLAAKLSGRSPRISAGVVLRSCEARALIELTKMQQASLESLTIISIDCAGTFNVPNYRKLSNAGDGLWKELFKGAADAPQAARLEMRQACKMCEKPVFQGRPDVDIEIHLHGVDVEQQIEIRMPDTLGERLGLTAVEASGSRAGVMDALVNARVQARDDIFADIRARLGNDGEQTASGIQAVFGDCIRCHNCMTVCPICYCKTCVFKSHIFDHEPNQYLGWAKAKGALRMPADSVLFHLTRMNHMVLSCVGCGMCTEACPAELPVGAVFRAVGQRVQGTFEYVPGNSVDDPLPLVTFKADEWTEVGE